MNSEENPTNNYDVIHNPEGQDIVPIVGGLEGETNPLARTNAENPNNIVTYGIIAAALLVVIISIIYSIRKRNKPIPF